jgi:hypothetical protein
MTTTLIKIIALIFMLIDHIGEFIPGTPVYLRWVGRIAAPIFIYFVIIGMTHTSNKHRYLFRLYIASVIMACINVIINQNYNTGVGLTNNFFATLFTVALLIYVIDKRSWRYFSIYLIWQMISTVLSTLITEIFILNTALRYPFYGAIFGNVIYVEGGILFVLLGVVFYLFRNKKQLVISYSIYCLFIFLVYEKWGGSLNPFSQFLLPFADFQWIMILALPLLYFYNGEKGVGLNIFSISFIQYILSFYILLEGKNSITVSQLNELAIFSLY